MPAGPMPAGPVAVHRLTRKLVGTSMRSKDLAKASGLDLRQPQGALAEGQCGLGERATIGRASNEGHSCLAKTRLVIVRFAE